MMMKKKINILLVVVVLGLWATVLYRYANRFFYSGDVLAFKEISRNAALPDKIKKDTFELAPLVNDPFLNRRISKPVERKHTVHNNEIKPKLKLESKQLKMISLFPDVKYFGFIKSKDKKEELILIKVNNSLHKTRLNDDCDGVVVNKIYKDSIQVIFEKQIRVIKK